MKSADSAKAESFYTANLRLKTEATHEDSDSAKAESFYTAPLRLQTEAIHFRIISRSRKVSPKTI